MDNIIPVLYREYGKYVNSSRAFPLDLDGLKPVERKLLISAYQIAKDKFVKSARISGHCLSGTTKIKLANGTIKTIEELYNENCLNFYVFAFDINLNKPVITKVESVKLVKYVNTLIKIETESGSIFCTKDHLWLTKEGEYKETSNLKIGDSLETIKFGITDDNRKFENEHTMDLNGYEVVRHNKKYYYSHWLADEYNIKIEKYKQMNQNDIRYVRHHIDLNFLNNNPENIIQIHQGEHWKIHIENWINYEGGREFLIQHAKEVHKNNPEISENLTNYVYKKLEEDPDYCRKISKQAWESYSPEERENLITKISKARINYFKNDENRLQHSKTIKKYWNNEKSNNHRETNRKCGLELCKNLKNNHKIK